MPDRLPALVERLKTHADALMPNGIDTTNAQLQRLAVGHAPEAMLDAAAHLEAVIAVAREMEALAEKGYNDAQGVDPERIQRLAGCLTHGPGEERQ